MTKALGTRNPAKIIESLDAQREVEEFLKAGGKIQQVGHEATSYNYTGPRKVEPNGRVLAVKQKRKSDDNLGDQE
jgi:hypothetical protein